MSLTHLSVQPISSAILLRLLAFLSLRMYIRQKASASEQPILRSLPSRGRRIMDGVLFRYAFNGFGLWSRFFLILRQDMTIICIQIGDYNILIYN